MDRIPVWKLLLKLSPPVMLALLIQSVYNVVDSYYVARYSQDGLTALSLIFPIQLLMTALATGTGTGLNLLISGMEGRGKTAAQGDVVKSGLLLGLLNFIVFAGVGLWLVQPFYEMSSQRQAVQEMGVQYARIVFVGALGLFEESVCTKLLQARGDMVTPMLAQVVGAGINLLLDPVLIFGLWGAPVLGVAGAGVATVVGQWAALFITLAAVWRKYGMRGSASCKWGVEIYRQGLPSILMQSLYTFYIVGLNLILKRFTEDAVTVLGIYYKLQTFFFIPLMGLQQVVVPIISFNHSAGDEFRIRETLRCAVAVSVTVMAVAVVGFMLFPRQLIGVFSGEPALFEIGAVALRLISASFIPCGFTMMYTVYFQGIGQGKSSIMVTLLRQVALLVPLAWIFHFIGLEFVWLTFPATEFLAMAFCLRLERSRKK